MRQKMEMATANLRGKRGQFGFTVETLTVPTMRKTDNPFIGRVTKKTIYTNAVLGCNYSNVINNRLVREGKEPTFVAQPRKGMKRENEFFLVSLKDPNKFYLEIGLGKNTGTDSTFFLDGKPATPSEEKEIKSFISEKKPTISTQTNAGLSAKNQYPTTTTSFENVRRITQGDTIIW